MKPEPTREEMISLIQKHLLTNVNFIFWSDEEIKKIYDVLKEREKK